MSQNMTSEQLAAQFDAYATEGFDAPPGSAIARIADAWSCAARQVRTKLAPNGELAKSLAAEADRLRDENEQLKERVESLEEQERLLQYQVKLVGFANEVLRGMVDTLNIENTKLKTERVPSIVCWAREVGITNKEKT